MNGLRDMVEQVPRLNQSPADNSPQPLAPARWNWNDVKKVLLIRLRSIGDTVLATPSIDALKRFLPHSEIDILVEDWVAPVLAEHPSLHSIVSFERGSLAARARVAREVRARRYDVVYNLHGGTTATFLTRATGAQHRVGYASYQYSQLHNHQAPRLCSFGDSRRRIRSNSNLHCWAGRACRSQIVRQRIWQLHARQISA